MRNSGPLHRWGTRAQALVRRALFRALARKPGVENAHLDRILGLAVTEVSRTIAAGLAEGRRAAWGDEYIWQEPGETGHPSTGYSDLIALFDRLALPAGATFADLGCGFGRAGFVVALLFPGVRFVGYELVEERVAAARAASERLALSDVSFEVADLARVRPVDADVYYVFCSFREETGRRVLEVLHEVARRRPIELVINTAMYGFEPEETPWLRLVEHAGIFGRYASQPLHAAGEPAPAAARSLA